MKNIFFILAILVSSSSFSQTFKIGKVNADGKPTLLIDVNKCRTVISQCANQRNATPFQPGDFSFTKLSHGQICLTGYEKNSTGKIIRGTRIQCMQDDENNLIIVKNSFTENITGKSFDTPTIQE